MPHVVPQASRASRRLIVARSEGPHQLAIATLRTLEQRLKLLEEEPALMQSLCNVYIQDFICLGYHLPEACNLLPAHGAATPETSSLTEDDLDLG